MIKVLNPFTLISEFIIFLFKAVGFTITLLVQLLWLNTRGHSDKTAHALGEYGRELTKEFFEIFRSKPTH